jgi:hypothetical protein
MPGTEDLRAEGLLMKMAVITTGEVMDELANAKGPWERTPSLPRVVCWSHSLSSVTYRCL